MRKGTRQRAEGSVELDVKRSNPGRTIPINPKNQLRFEIQLSLASASIKHIEHARLGFLCGSTLIRTGQSKEHRKVDGIKISDTAGALN